MCVGVTSAVSTSLCVLAGSWGRVSSTVANSVLSARPTSWTTQRDKETSETCIDSHHPQQTNKNPASVDDAVRAKTRTSKMRSVWLVFVCFSCSRLSFRKTITASSWQMMRSLQPWASLLKLSSHRTPLAQQRRRVSMLSQWYRRPLRSCGAIWAVAAARFGQRGQGSNRVFWTGGQQRIWHSGEERRQMQICCTNRIRCKRSLRVKVTSENLSLPK